MTFEWEGETLHYISEGEGPTVLLLHGLGGNINNWVLQRRHLSLTHRVISLDLPGHGRSTGRSVPFSDYWRAIEATLNHAGVAQATLLGLAIGARAGLAFAARCPERVSGLIVVNAFLHLTPDDRADRLALYDLLQEEDGARLWAEQLIPRMGIEAHSTIVRGFLRAMQTVDPLHLRRIFREQEAYDQRSEIRAMTCPVLVVRGRKDQLMPAYSAEELRDAARNGELAVLDAGHLPYLETPDAFNNCVSDFLNRHRL